MTTEWDVYLSGEIHTDWRDEIRAGAEAAKYPQHSLVPFWTMIPVT